MTATATVVRFASQPENWYRPNRGDPSPGDDERHVVNLDFGIRVVFSWTEIDDDGGKVYRHMSMTVAIPSGGMPHPRIVEAVARELGFTGAPSKWNWSMEDPSNPLAVQVAQEMTC